MKNSEKTRERRSMATAAIAAEFKKAMKTVTVIEGFDHAAPREEPHHDQALEGKTAGVGENRPAEEIEKDCTRHPGDCLGPPLR